MTTVSAPALPTPRQLWRRSRWYLAFAVALLLVGLLITGLGGNSQFPALDPRSTDPDGTRAVVHLLEQQGLTTRTVDSTDDLAAALRERGTTVVLPEPDLLTPDQLKLLGTVHRGSDSRLVLIAPQSAALDALAPGITVASVDGVPQGIASSSVKADCTLPEADRAGTAELGGLLYRRGTDDIGCYPRLGEYPLVRHTDEGSRELLVLGSGRLLTNQRLTTSGNASLALGLLGSRPHLVWYLPDYNATAASAVQPKTLTDYIPSGWYWATAQLAIAALLAALWRARRLGPVVTENLPVVVRATETTEGRARLYERANARGRAADALRRAARHRLATALGIPLSSGEPDPTPLCAATADRLARPAADIHALLYGGPPTDDAALLRLTDDLDALERQVRQP